MTLALSIQALLFLAPALVGAFVGVRWRTLPVRHTYLIASVNIALAGDQGRSKDRMAQACDAHRPCSGAIPVHSTPRLQRGKAVSGRGLEQLLVPQAVRHPRRRLQTLRLYGSTVYAALAERAGLDPSQGVTYLRQYDRVELRFREALARFLIGDARIPCIGDARAAGLAAPFF